MRRTMLMGLLGMVISSPAVRAQGLDWVASALPERAYDFGTVARGSQVRHAFPLINRSDQEIRIADWRTKCGCTNVRVGAKVIPPGTQTTIEATIDTTKFLGYKPSGLTLDLRPSHIRRGRPQPDLLHPGRHRDEPGPDRFRHRPAVRQDAPGLADPDLRRRTLGLGGHEDEDPDARR